ncbi:hypothetical protein ACFLQ6_01525 [Thermoproteota archaeon]
MKLKRHISVTQNDDWSCALCAVRIIFRFLKKRGITNQQLVNDLKNLDLPISTAGIFISEVGALSLIRGQKCKLNYPKNILPEISFPYFNNKLTLPKQGIKLNHIHGHLRKGFYRSLFTYLGLGGQAIIFENNKPNFRDIIKALNRKSCVLVSINCREYYDIKENWLHTIAFIPSFGKSHPIDVYKKRGRFVYGSRWSKHLKHSESYDWNNWAGEMLEIY